MTARHGFLLGLALGLTFSLGFGAATLMQTHASAQAAAPTRARWEYLREDHGWDGGRWAQQAGQQGWEMFDFEQGDAQDRGMYFRRPLP